MRLLGQLLRFLGKELPHPVALERLCISVQFDLGEAAAVLALPPRLGVGFISQGELVGGAVQELALGQEFVV